MSANYTFWLLPAEPYKGRLQKIIGELAKEFDAPDFVPHASLYRAPAKPDEALALIEKIASAYGLLELETQSLQQSSRYSKTFFLQFQESALMRRMSEIAQANVAASSDYTFDPHLSLLYKNMDENRRIELCNRPILQMGKYLFDTVCAVEFEAPWSEKAAREYKIIIERKLCS